MSVVSYKEPQQFQQRTSCSSSFHTISSESRSAKKRRLREELRTSKRAYRSLPSTPKIKPQDSNEFHSQISTPKSDVSWGKNTANFILQKTKLTLEGMIESKKQRRKDKKMEKKMMKSMSESNGAANSSLVNTMKEKLAKSKHLDSTPEINVVRRKVMKELHFMKRHSKALVGAKKRKKLNNLLSKL